MKKREIICLPQVGVNDEYAKVIKWHKQKGEWVTKGDFVCAVETSKAVYDVEADSEGYMIPLATAGEDIKIGVALGVLSPEDEDVHTVREWLVKGRISQETQNQETEPAFTKKALILANRLGIDISHVPVKIEKITEADVMEFAENSDFKSKTAKDLVEDLYPENKTERLLIIGGGDGAVQLLDAISHVKQQRAVMIFDDNPDIQQKEIMGVPVIGPVSLEKARELYKSGRFDSAITSVSTSIHFREKIYNEWTSSGIPFTNIIHPTVSWGSNTSIGSGNVILAFCHIGPCSKIGNNNFLSAYTNIEHHSVLGSHCSFGPGIYTSSSVRIDDRVRMGTGIFIEPHLSIGSDSIVGSGSIIVNHIPSSSIVKLKSNNFIKHRESQ